MRNASGQLGENKRQWKESEQEHKQQNFLWAQRHFLIKRVTRKFHVATIMAKNVQKSVLHVPIFFLLIRPTDFVWVSRCRRRLRLHDFIFCLSKWSFLYSDAIRCNKKEVNI